MASAPVASIVLVRAVGLASSVGGHDNDCTHVCGKHPTSIFSVGPIVFGKFGKNASQIQNVNNKYSPLCQLLAASSKHVSRQSTSPESHLPGSLRLPGSLLSACHRDISVF